MELETFYCIICSTPWGEHCRSNVSLPQIASVNQSEDNKASAEQQVVGPETVAAPAVQPFKQELQNSSSSSISSSNTTTLPHVLIDKVFGNYDVFTLVRIQL